jgi:tRNA-dihydrouridine synthase B
MDFEGECEPRVVQLAGSEPDSMADAARRNVELGAQIVDINMGCPAKKVCGKLCGSALLRDELLVGRILDAVVAAVHVPVTLKIRTGWNRERRNAVTVARLAENCGVKAIAVHGRTREDFYEGEAEYETIREIKSAVRIPVFANGDIDNAEKARAVLDFTGADGVMLGRASHGTPWIFREVNYFLESGCSPEPLSRGEVSAIIRAHLESLYSFYGEHTGVRVARKHLGWYCKSLLELASLRGPLLEAQNSSSQFALAKSILDAWIEGTWGASDAGEEERSGAKRAHD